MSRFIFAVIASLFANCWLAPSLGLASTPKFDGAVVAQVLFAKGEVQKSLGIDHGNTLLRKGDAIHVGEVITTGKGQVQLQFTDGALISLESQSRFVVNDYAFEKVNPKMQLSLFAGGLRALTGLIGKTKPESYKLTTPTATVGIRGTEYRVEIKDGGSLLTVANGGITVGVPSGLSVQVARGESVSSSAVASGLSAKSASASKTDASTKAQATPGKAAESSQKVDPLSQMTPSTPIMHMAWNSGGAQAVTSNLTPYVQVFIDASGQIVQIQRFSTAANGFAPATTANANGAIVQDHVSGGQSDLLIAGRFVGGTNNNFSANGNAAGSATNTETGHFVVGMPLAQVPTAGTATYHMVGQSNPTCSGAHANCQGVTVTASSIGVNFAQPLAAPTLSMNINNGSGQVYAVGNLAMTRTSPGQFSVSTANFQASGAFFGSGANSAGVVYSANTISVGTVNGAVAYKKQ